MSNLKRQVHEAAEAHPEAWDRFSTNQFDEGMGNARRGLALSGPYVVCSYCG